MAEDQTTTDPAVEETGAEALPAEPTEQTAATDESQQDTSTETGEQDSSEQDSLPEVDEELRKFADSHGLELNTPSEVKAAKLARDNQQDFHKQRHEAKLEQSLGEVETSSDEVQQLRGEVVALKADLMADRLRKTEKLTPENETAFVEYLNTNPLKKQLVQHGYMTLQEAYRLSGVGTTDPSVLKSEGAKGALETLAGNLSAAAVRPSATNPAPSTKKEDPFLKGLMQ